MIGMIFAAGLGTRLKPFTLSNPKALVPVGGKPMLQRVIERMKEAGITYIVINTHHFANKIVDFIKGNDNFGIDIRISDERDLLLDTGGGIAHAASLLDLGDSILVHNADIYTDFSIKDMEQAHNLNRADATLLCSERQSSRMLYFDEKNNLAGWQNLKTGETRPTGFTLEPNMKPLAFGGVHIISPNLLPAFTKEGDSIGRVFSIIPFYLNNINRYKIKSWTPSGIFNWFDVGKPETLEAAENHIFKEKT